jgi:hypothetical protein
VIVYDLRARRKIEVRLPNWRWILVPDACTPDLALGPSGEAVITSSVYPTLWTIDPDTLAVTVHRLALPAAEAKEVGFCSLVYSHENASFFAVGSDGYLWKLDRDMQDVRRIGLSTPMTGTYDLSVQPGRDGGQAAVKLCAHAPHASWSVDLSSSSPAAEVKAARCMP